MKGNDWIFELFLSGLPLKVPDRSLTRQRVFRACWRAQAHPLTGENFRNGFSAVSRRVLAQVDMRQNPPNIQEIANSTRYQRPVYTLPKNIIPVVEQMVVGIDLPMYGRWRREVDVSIVDTYLHIQTYIHLSTPAMHQHQASLPWPWPAHNPPSTACPASFSSSFNPKEVLYNTISLSSCFQWRTLNLLHHTSLVFRTLAAVGTSRQGRQRTHY